MRELLETVWAPAKAQAHRECERLQKLAVDDGANIQIEPWDWRHYAERVRSAELSVTFVSNARIARLNREHLGHSGPTDVISFGFAPTAEGGPLTGDIYIAPDVARRNAVAHGAGVREELLRLVIHGTLHVIGHDHPVNAARYESAMWRRQEQLLQRVLQSA